MNPLKRALTAVLAATACALATSALAQTWPTQSVRIIVPFTPGTGMDTIARAVGPRLSERLGQPVVIVNQPGASGNIGADTVAKATDGHTLLMGANTMLWPRRCTRTCRSIRSRTLPPSRWRPMAR